MKKSKTEINKLKNELKDEINPNKKLLSTELELDDKSYVVEDSEKAEEETEKKAINEEETGNSDSKQQTLTVKEELDSIIKDLLACDKIYFISRDIHYATSLEAALKIKEVSYISCEAILAGELKHGPLALVDSKFVCIVIVNNDDIYQKMMNAISLIETREGKPIILCSSDIADKFSEYKRIIVPSTCKEVQSVLNIIPIQYISYKLGILKGNDVDKPRNLAKSVTTE